KNRPKRHPPGVASRQDRFVEVTGDGGAAQIGCGEPHALLLGKTDHIEMKGQILTGAMQMLSNDKPSENAETAIVFSGIDHGVVMRTDNQGLGVSGSAGEPADHITDGIDVRL